MIDPHPFTVFLLGVILLGLYLLSLDDLPSTKLSFAKILLPCLMVAVIFGVLYLVKKGIFG